jgi:hypothetical protein
MCTFGWNWVKLPYLIVAATSCGTTQTRFCWMHSLMTTVFFYFFLTHTTFKGRSEGLTRHNTHATRRILAGIYTHGLPSEHMWRTNDYGI